LIDSLLQTARSARPPLAVLLFAGALFAVPLVAARQEPALTVASPDGRTIVSISAPEGRLHWSATRDRRAVVVPSRLGFTFRDAPALGEHLFPQGESCAHII